MDEIKSTYINALLADAAYVELTINGEPLSPSAQLANLTARLTAPQAQYLLDEFDILTQTLSPNGGFDAVIQKNGVRSCILPLPIASAFDSLHL